MTLGKINLHCILKAVGVRHTSFKQVSKFSEENLSTEEVKALNSLVKIKDMLIQKAEKGNSIVILNRSDYISKLSKILEDTL